MVCHPRRSRLRASSRGVGGRPRALDTDGIEMARALYEMKGQDGKRTYTVQQITDRLGVGRATIYRNLDADDTQGPGSAEPASLARPGSSELSTIVVPGLGEHL
ncbi:helix-turn-helix domain-containing protein [Nonomuraea sp. B19D2]|uniref:helix-turn-helix domain-containing protein n=1 Tax=Nonomuraea sp. B19D2 TaxID=3159561 RepID=UPI0032DAB338